MAYGQHYIPRSGYIIVENYRIKQLFVVDDR